MKQPRKQPNKPAITIIKRPPTLFELMGEMSQLSYKIEAGLIDPKLARETFLAKNGVMRGYSQIVSIMRSMPDLRHGASGLLGLPPAPAPKAPEKPRLSEPQKPSGAA